jgi:hypothetical protein
MGPLWAGGQVNVSAWRAGETVDKALLFDKTI